MHAVHPSRVADGVSLLPERIDLGGALREVRMEDALMSSR
jgi:hypothetical protein